MNYDTIRLAASAARVCPSRHSCNRYDDVMAPWFRAEPSGDRCPECDAYETRRAAGARGELRPFLIAAIGVSRHYGGPEEGGWWYNRTEILEIRQAYTMRAGLRHARELRAKYPQPRYPIGSMANRGEPEVYITCVYDESMLPTETTGRPTYE